MPADGHGTTQHGGDDDAPGGGSSRSLRLAPERSGRVRSDGDRRPVVVVIGAGQLARMTAPAANALDVELRVLAASADDGAVAVAPGAVVGDWEDDDTVLALADGADVITFDHELVDAAIVARWEAAGLAVRPGSATLALAADKAAQRAAMVEAGLPVPAHGIATTVAEVAALGERMGWPLVGKAARGGYDGRGVFWLDRAEDAGVVLAGLPAGVPLVVEPLLRLEAEVAVQVARAPDGRMVTYPAVRTEQVDGICVSVVAPSGLDPALEAEAQHLTRRAAEAVGAVGLLAVEFFVVDGRLMVNELAPRTHNSGHYSIEACTTSQFENHLRAVLGLPLGDPGLQVPAAAMVNVLGADESPSPRAALEAALSHPGAKVHLYGKDHRPGRKLGHVTVCADDPGTALAAARGAAAALAGGGAPR
jgi:5-(carboxyamino)imidazole ribonucleotide synthase